MINSKPINSVSAPNAISSHSANDDSNLKYARIGYKNLLVSGDGASQSLAIIPNTYERWADSSGTMTGVFQLATNEDIDFVAIGAHNLFSAGVTSIEISYRQNLSVGYTVIETFTPVSDEAIMRLYDTISNVIEVRILINGVNANSTREIAVVYAGTALVMEQPIYGGHSPIDLSAKTEYQNSMSDTGQFLGRTVISKGIETDYSWRHLSPDWYRGNFQPFVDSAKRLPFFIKWRPDLYDSAAFGYTLDDIKPSNMGGGHQLMSVGFKMRGHSD